MRKPLKPRQSALWWWHHPYYRRYMLREATAVPLFLYALCLLYGVRELGRGEAAFNAWLAFMGSPAIITLQTVSLLAVLWHAWTWFQLLPQILVIPTRKGSVPGHWLRLAHVVPAVLCWVLLPLLAWWALGRFAGGVA
ncbi:MAG: hypothetical protein ABR612_12530 [Chromatocurvus sp.]